MAVLSIFALRCLAAPDDVVVRGDDIVQVKLARGGEFITFVDRSGSTPMLTRRGTRAGGDEALLPWASNYVGYQVAPHADSVLLLQSGPKGATVLFAHAGSSAWTPAPVALDHRVAGFGNAGSGAFKVLTQSDDGALSVSDVDFASGRVVGAAGVGIANDIAYDIRGDVVAVGTDQGWRRATRADASARESAAVPLAAAPIVAARDGSRILFQGMDATGRSVLKQLDLRQQQVSTIAGSVDVAWPLLDPTSGRLDGFATYRDGYSWQVLDPELVPHLHFLEERLGAPTFVAARSDADDVWLVVPTTTTASPTYSVYMPKEKTLRSLVRLRSAAAVEMPRTELGWTRSADGTPIQILVSPPAPESCPKRDQCAFVVNLHGGPHKRDQLQFDAETYWLQSLGYWVLRVNFRGSTGFGTEFAMASNGEWGGKVIDDVAAATRWFQEHYDLQNRSGMTIGTSFGGFAALATATRLPETFACAASLSGGGDLEAFARLIAERRPQIDVTTEVGDTRKPDDLARIRSQSPLHALGDARTAFLVEYGAQDQVSIPEESSNFAEALRAHGRDHLEVEYLDQGHDLATPSTRTFHYALLREFLAHCATPDRPFRAPTPPDGSAIRVAGSPTFVGSHR